MELEDLKKQFQASNRRVMKIKEKQQVEFHKVREIKHDPELQTKDVNAEFKKNNTFGNRIADKVAAFGGSWKFIIIFAVFLFVWMTLNNLGIVHFDPYPYILLNLALSTIAAFQAPVIMMSQNRAADRDKLDADNDAKVNKSASKKLDSEMSRMDHQKARIDEIDTKINLVAQYLIDKEEKSTDK